MSFFNAANRLETRSGGLFIAGTNAATSRLWLLKTVPGTFVVPSHRYLWGPAVDQLLADEQVPEGDSPGDTYWTLTDKEGSITDVVDNDGTLRLHRAFDAFGNVIEGSEAHYDSSGDPVSSGSEYIDEAFAYTGRWFDKDTGLQNNLNRWYDPEIGRWMSEDPIGFNGGDANLYRYVGNQPTTFVDPSGLWIFGDPEWQKGYDQEVQIVRQMNGIFGTNHQRLDKFTPLERARIEAAMQAAGQPFPADAWDNGYIKAYEDALRSRNNALDAAKACAYGAAAADAAALPTYGALRGLAALAARSALAARAAQMAGALKALDEANNRRDWLGTYIGLLGPEAQSIFEARMKDIDDQIDHLKRLIDILQGD